VNNKNKHHKKQSYKNNHGMLQTPRITQKSALISIAVLVDTWLKHFSGLKPKDILCVLVDSVTRDLTDTVLGKGRLNVVKTDNIAHFYN